MKPPPPRKPIDRDEVRRLRVEEGFSGAEIARRLRRTAPAVRAVIKELDLPLRPERRVDDEKWGRRLYSLWTSLRRRCTNPRDRLHPRYGARGFAVCKEWESFWSFHDWAVASGYRPGLNLEVVGRSRRFGPKSCRWITAQERMRRDGHPGGRRAKRRITAFGETKTATEWARDRRCFVSADLLRARVRKGVPPEQAISQPSGWPIGKDGRRARSPEGPRKLLDWPEIVRLHLEDGLAPREIASRIDADESTVRHGLKERGAWRRPEPLGPHAARLRKVWENVRRRCEDDADLSYPYYGAKGARLCAAWGDFRTFHRWAVNHGYQPGLCLMRRTGTRVYSPRNCRWGTRREAVVGARHPDSSMPARWTVDAFGERKGPTEWSRDARCAVSLSGLLRRLRSGWRPEEAISAPPRTRGRSDSPTRVIEAFGETKGLVEWSRDRRCKVTYTALAERLDRGMAAEEAIATPPFASSHAR